MRLSKQNRLHYIWLVLVLISTLFTQLAFGYDLEKDVVEFKLNNGMRWLLVKRHRAPVFSGIVIVRVGGADEVPGKTGLAHVFEHMAFKGTSRLGTRNFAKEKPILDEIERVGEELTKAEQEGDKQKAKELEAEFKSLSEKEAAYQIKNEVWELMVRNGASDLNAYTSKDVTAFHSSMPINRLALWMDIISQMVAEPAYREFYTERNVILEERRSGVENNPDGKMSDLLLETASQEGPYHWSVSGTSEDIKGFTIKDAREFHDRYYVAPNMVGVLVGDLNIDQTKKLLERYFGSIPATPPPTHEEIYHNKGGGIKKLRFNAEPATIIAYHKPTLPNPDEFVFDVLETLLCDGPTSRLEKRLVYDEKVASEISCTDSYPGSRLPNLMLIWAEPNRPHSAKELASKVEEELVRLQNEYVSDEELSRVRTKVTASILYSLEKNLGLAMSLAEFEAIYGDWRLIAKYPKLVEQVAADDVMRAAKQYFTKENMTEILRLKK